MNNEILMIVLIVVFSAVPWAALGFGYTQIRKAYKKRQNKKRDMIYSIQEITTAIMRLSKQNKGGTFIVKQNDKLESVIVDSEEIDAKLSTDLLVNIFEGSTTPLHDGAVIISGSRIEAAGAFITHLSQKELPRKFGTRHRSALGISEATDAISIILSEESGHVTICKNGEYNTIEDISEIRNGISNALFGEADED